MSKIIECVVDTNSKKEREELINYVSEKELFISVIDDSEGFKAIGIKKYDTYGYLDFLCANELLKKDECKHFASLEEFISYHEEN